MIMEPSVEGLHKKSEQNWQAGELCFANELYDSAASRFYYSTFQAVIYSHRVSPIDSPEAIPSDKSTPKHRCAERAVGKIGKDGRRAMRNYGRLLVLRETADYEPEPVDKNKLLELKPHAAAIRNFFLSRAKK